MGKKKALSMLLVFTMILGCFGGIALSSTESKAASIYFAGKYKCTDIYEKGYFGYPAILKLNQYSSAEGTEVGNFKIRLLVDGTTTVRKGSLTRIGKNK